MFIAILKELLINILIPLRALRFRHLYNNYRSELKALKTEGIFVKPDYMSAQRCEFLRDKIDKYIEAKSTNVWSDEEGADHRIYFINELDDDFKAFYDTPYFRDILKAYLGSDDPKGMLLAARIDYTENNKGSGGGWHRDSPFTNQFKAICYLSDVDIDNGPFQIIKRSHTSSSVLKSLIKGVLKPSVYRFTEQNVADYTDKLRQEVTSVTAKQGALVLADTKALHRGKPLEKGSRYVLFCYYWHDAVPNHFSSLKQNS